MPADHSGWRLRIRPNLDGIPQELKDQGRWINWRLDPPSKPGKKPRKTPINPKTGGLASSTDPSTWGSFAEAVACMEAKDLAGLGFMFEGSGYVGVDLDNCRDSETGEIASWAMEIVATLKTYTEISPSGTGIHCIARGKLPPGRRRKGDIEMYDSGRYFATTGVPVERES